jgi:hypothetical protein
MSDELEVRDLISHLYEAANQARPVGLSIDASNPSAAGAALDYLMQHARATEGALKKLGQLMDELRAHDRGTAAAIAAAAATAEEAVNALQLAAASAPAAGADKDEAEEVEEDEAAAPAGDGDEDQDEAAKAGPTGVDSAKS